MTDAEKLTHCAGCHDDIYNHGNMSSTGRCWLLPDMRLVWKKEVHIDQRPPWTHKPIRVPQCYHKPKFIYLEPNRTE